MIPYLFAVVTQWWRWFWPPRPRAVPWLTRPHLAALAQTTPAALPAFVRESAAAQTYLTLLGPLDWGHFPERPTSRLWPGPAPLPRAPFVAAYLLKLDKGLKSMGKLRAALVEQPALVWLFGFPLVPSAAYRWGFDVERSLPTARHFSRVLRTLERSQASFLFQATVRLLDAELPAECHFGNEISLDTKHILAWVRENNPKAKVAHRYDKTRQPRGDRDCKLGCKKRDNMPTHDGSDHAPTQEGLPAARRRWASSTGAMPRALWRPRTRCTASLSWPNSPSPLTRVTRATFTRSWRRSKQIWGANPSMAPLTKPMTRFMCTNISTTLAALPRSPGQTVAPRSSSMRMAYRSVPLGSPCRAARPIGNVPIAWSNMNVRAMPAPWFSPSAPGTSAPLLMQTGPRAVSPPYRPAQATASVTNLTVPVRCIQICTSFPTAWAKFKNQQIDTNKFAELTLSLKAEHYPFWSKGRLEDVAKAQLFASGVKTDVTVSSQPDGSGETDAISETGGESIGNLRGCTLEKTRPQKPDEVLTRYLSDNSMENLWLAITWGPKP